VIIRGQNAVMIIKYREREKERKKDALFSFLRGVFYKGWYEVAYFIRLLER